MTKDEALKMALDALHLWVWTNDTSQLENAHDALGLAHAEAFWAETKLKEKNAA